MADKKISQLTAASTPLAGTEVLPIVQSSSTVKVSVANLTAGRAVSALSLSATAGLKNTSSGSNSVSAPDSMLFTDGANKNWLWQMDASGGMAGWIYESGGAGWQKFLSATSAGNVTFNTGNLIQGTAAKGVNFTANTGAAGMTSQLLNWYEEGTWTPVPTPVSGTIISYTSTGRYTRIGNQVTVALRLDIVNVGTAGALLNIAGLPFTSLSAASVSAGAFKEVGVTGDDWTLYVTPSTTVLAGRTYNNGNAIGNGYIFYGSCTYFTT